MRASSTTTLGCCSPPTPWPASKPPTCCVPSSPPARPTDCLNRCSPTTAPSSPPTPAAARSSSSQLSSAWASRPSTPAPTTLRPAARPPPRTPTSASATTASTAAAGFTLRYLSRLRHIAVGRAHKHQRVTLLVADAEVRVLAEDGSLIRELTLDADRVYQRLGGPRVVQDVVRQVSTMS